MGVKESGSAFGEAVMGMERAGSNISRAGGWIVSSGRQGIGGGSACPSRSCVRGPFCSSAKG